MLSLTKSRVLGGLLTIALAGLAALAFAQDKDAVIKNRADAMRALVVAVKGGSKDAIKVAYEDLGVCKDCHTPFRERLKD